MAIPSAIPAAPRTVPPIRQESSRISTWQGRLISNAAETCKKIGTVAFAALVILVAATAAIACAAGVIGFLTGVSFLPIALGLYLVGVVPKISTVAMSVLAPLGLMLGAGAVFAAIASLIKKKEPVAPAQTPTTQPISHPIDWTRTRIVPFA